MGSVTLNGATSGQITISPPAVAGSNTITLPAATGTVLTTAGGQTIIGTTTVSNLAMNGSSSGTTTLSPSATAFGTITFPAGTGTVAVNGVSSNIGSGTAQASTSGTAITFTGIPSYVKRITVMFNGVSSSGSSVQLIRIGSGSVATTGYLSTGGNVGSGGTPTISQFTTGFGVSGGTGSAAVRTGNFVLNNISGNTWVMSGVSVRTDTTDIQWAGGVLALSGTIDRIQVTTVNGTDTFTAGSINIMYE